MRKKGEGKTAHEGRNTYRNSWNHILYDLKHHISILSDLKMIYNHQNVRQSINMMTSFRVLKERKILPGHLEVNEVCFFLYWFLYLLFKNIFEIMRH